MSINPIEIPTGAVRYNTDSNMMEVYVGDTWMSVVVSTPDLGNSNAGARGLIMGGYISPTGRSTIIDQIEIATTGSAASFGDLIKTTSFAGSTSDSHGGLSE